MAFVAGGQIVDLGGLGHGQQEIVGRIGRSVDVRKLRQDRREIHQLVVQSAGRCGSRDPLRFLNPSSPSDANKFLYLKQFSGHESLLKNRPGPHLASTAR